MRVPLSAASRMSVFSSFWKALLTSPLGEPSLGLLFRLDERFAHLVEDGPAHLVARELLGDVERLAQRVLVAEHRLDRFLVLLGRLELDGLPADHLAELRDGRADLLDDLVRELDGADDDLFAELVHAAFDHRHGVGRAGDHHVHLGLGPLGVVGEGDVLAVDQGDTGRTDGTEKGHLGQRQGRATAVDGQHVGIVELVVRDDERLDLGIHLVPVGPERTDGPVRHAHREDLLRGRSGLALQEAAGDLAGGVALLAVVDGEGKEIEPGSRRRHRGAGDHHRVSVPYDDRSSCQPRHAAGLDTQGLPPDIDRHFVNGQTSSYLRIPQLLDQRAVGRGVLSSIVAKQGRSTTDQLEQAAPCGVVLGELLQVLGQVPDAVRQDGNLKTCGACVALAFPVLLDDRGFARVLDGHRGPPSPPVRPTVVATAPGRGRVGIRVLCVSYSTVQRGTVPVGAGAPREKRAAPPSRRGAPLLPSGHTVRGWEVATRRLRPPAIRAGMEVLRPGAGLSRCGNLLVSGGPRDADTVPSRPLSAGNRETRGLRTGRDPRRNGHSI